MVKSMHFLIRYNNAEQKNHTKDAGVRAIKYLGHLGRQFQVIEQTNLNLS